MCYFLEYSFKFYFKILFNEILFISHCHQLIRNFNNEQTIFLHYLIWKKIKYFYECKRIYKNKVKMKKGANYKLEFTIRRFVI